MKSSAIVLAAHAATLVPMAWPAIPAQAAHQGRDGNAAAKEKLGTDVKFVSGPAPAAKEISAPITSNKKTNFANKSDKEGCEWAFLSAMISLKERATAEGGNAVINIQSYYKKNEFSSATEYECGAGAIMGGVTLRGTVVKL